MRRDFLPWHHHCGHPEVVVPVRVDPTGRRGPTPNAARGGRWRTVGPGWFVPIGIDGSQTDQRIVEAAIRLSAYGAVTGWAALHWQGARWFERSGPVSLATGDAGIRSVEGVAISEEQLLPHHIVVVDGLRITMPVRSTLFEMRYATSDLGAMTALDMACYSDLVSLEEARAYAARLGTWTGIPQARTALSLGDENIWSPTEVAMAALWLESGLGATLSNHPVFDLPGRHLMTPDRIDPVAGVVGEYDGAGHLDRGRQRRDVRRDDLYRRLGLEQVTMTAPDLFEPGAALSRLRAAYARAQARPVLDRAWTVELPPWWISTRTVTERRSLDLHQRSRLLRYRDAA